MTLDETRQLGIEFERRLQTINPTLKIIDKIDTSDIYAYLNMYQELYVKLLYVLDQQVESDTRSSNRILDILQPLICRSEHSPISKDDRSSTFDLDTNYWLYLRSSSVVTGTYKNYSKLTEIPNIQFKLADINDLVDLAYDQDRIMRNPVITIAQYSGNPETNKTFEVIHDKYTKIKSVRLIYVRKPNSFSILTDDACELPMTCFDDLVNGAVDLYFNDKYRIPIATSAARNRNRRSTDDNDNTTA